MSDEIERLRSQLMALGHVLAKDDGFDPSSNGVERAKMLGRAEAALSRLSRAEAIVKAAQALKDVDIDGATLETEQEELDATVKIRKARNELYRALDSK